MALNKRGKTEVSTVLMWIAVLLVIAYVANFNGFQDSVNGFFHKTPAAPTQPTTVNLVTGDCPADGTTSLTLNVQDALTSTATNVNAEYFVYNGNQLITEGTTGTDGAVTFDLACGKDYKMVVMNSTSDIGYYAEIVDLSPRIAQETKNVKLVGFGHGQILGIENAAVSANAWELWNVKLGASVEKKFNIKFASNRSEDGFNKPIILCQANVTSIESVKLTSFSDGTPVTELSSLPKRITATSGYRYYAWEYGKMLKSTDPVVIASGAIKATANTPATTDYMSCIIIDQATYKVPNYKTATSIADAFKTASEDNSINNIGAIDTPSVDSSANFTFGGNY